MKAWFRMRLMIPHHEKTQVRHEDHTDFLLTQGRYSFI